MFVVRSGGPAASQPPEGGINPRTKRALAEMVGEVTGGRRFVKACVAPIPSLHLTGTSQQQATRRSAYAPCRSTKPLASGLGATPAAPGRSTAATTGAGKEPVPTAVLATALVLQGTSGCPSPTRSRRRSPTCGGNWCCATEPAFAQGACRRSASGSSRTTWMGPAEVTPTPIGRLLVRAGPRVRAPCMYSFRASSYAHGHPLLLTAAQGRDPPLVGSARHLGAPRGRAGRPGAAG